MEMSLKASVQLQIKLVSLHTHTSVLSTIISVTDNRLKFSCVGIVDYFVREKNFLLEDSENIWI